MGTIRFCDHCGTRLTGQLVRYTYGNEWEIRNEFNASHDKMIFAQVAQGGLPQPNTIKPTRKVVELGPCCVDVWMKRVEALCATSDPKEN